MKRAICFVILACLPASSFAQSPIRLSLTDAIARGFANSHRIAEARAREDGAKAAVTTAELGDKPTFNANAGYMRTNHVIDFGFPSPNGVRVIVFPDIPNNFTTRLSFQWPIYTAGRTDALERAALAEANAAGADIETTRADLRLEIVRALATNPQLLLLDEVMSGLTPKELTQCMQLISQLRNRGITIFMIEHVMQAIMGVCDRIIVLHYGSKIAEGMPAEIVKDPTVNAVYLGK